MNTPKNTVRLNFEFPRSEYPYLKMVCAKRGLSLKDFATEILLRAIEEAEDEMLSQKANERLTNMKDEDLITWDETKRKVGWDKKHGKIHN